MHFGPLSKLEGFRTKLLPKNFLKRLQCNDQKDSLRIIKVYALNQVIGLKTTLDDAHIDMDRSFSVFITMLKCVKNIDHPMLIVIVRYIIWGM